MTLPEHIEVTSRWVCLHCDRTGTVTYHPEPLSGNNALWHARMSHSAARGRPCSGELRFSTETREERPQFGFIGGE